MSFKISPLTSVEGFPSEKSSTIAYLNFEVSNLMGIVGRENSVIRTATHWLLLISHLIFFSVRERAEFNKSCNLIGSGSGRNFPIRPALGGRNHKKCFKFVWKPFK